MNTPKMIGQSQPGFALSRRDDLEKVARRAETLLTAIELGANKATVRDVAKLLRSAMDDARDDARHWDGYGADAVLRDLLKWLQGAKGWERWRSAWQQRITRFLDGSGL